MACPQIDNGNFTRISNEIIDALAMLPSLGGEGSQVLWLVLRNTYGYQRKTAEMSIKYIANGTGLKRPSVCRAIKRLLAKRLITRSENRITFNKNYDEWVVAKRLTVSQTANDHLPNGYSPISQTANKSLAKRLPNKERKKDIKENYNKDIVPDGTESSEIVEVLNAFKTTGLNPLMDFGNKTERKACADLLKAYGLEKVLSMVNYVSSLIGVQYSPSITTPYQLKNKLGALIAYSKKNQSKNLVANI